MRIEMSREYDPTRVCPQVLSEIKIIAIEERQKNGSLSPESLKILREWAKGDRETHYFNVLNLIEPLFPSL